MTATTLSEHRLRAEREAIAERYRTVVPLSADLEVPIFEGAIDVDGVDYQVRMILPPRYPSIPPVVGEIDGPGGRVVRPEWSMYRFSDGTICLFPHGNDSQTWGRDRLAVEALDRFVELKRLEIAQDRGPRRALYQAGWRLVVPPGIARVMLLPGSHGTIRVRAASTGRGDRFVDAIRFDAPQIPPVEIGASSPWIAALTAEQWIPWVHHAFDGRSWGEIGRTADHIIAAQDREPERHPRFAIDGVLAELQAPYVDPSLPGLGVDITMIAMIAARVALQTAARVVEVTAGLGPEDDHVLWTNRGGWVFDRPLQASAERFSRDPACPVCGSTPA